MYLSGFGNHHQTEALAGALPEHQNSPQHCPFGLYAEQLSGSAFTRPRHLNLKTWLYRKQPSVLQNDYQRYRKNPSIQYHSEQEPNPMRWSALPLPAKNVDFIDGLFPVAGHEAATAFIYQCSRSMEKRFFVNHDGELLFVPYQGEILLFTELGKLYIKPGQIAVIPRGIRFSVQLSEDYALGYLCENKGTPLTLPGLGPIGSNGLANPHHFLYPIAAYQDNTETITIVCKYQNHFWSTQSDHSPLNVLAWRGNYAPYSYDLSLFNTINTVSFDHPDPSIFTVLTSESPVPGVGNLDFVIFPSRWMVAEHTFRPPYFHRNIMSELMGLIYGQYDAKNEGFFPGGISIHNCMTPHGPDANTYQNAIQESLKPVRYENTLAFMFESCHPWLISTEAATSQYRQKDYSSCWSTLKSSEGSVQ